ncbi:MAG: class I SAM-dependent methyltransferase [Candidatus Omnitrophica bacterium]|nr:class I SAM-dependent methyltransferase [Candidatus Omnitrophota bacterium]
MRSLLFSNRLFSRWLLKFISVVMLPVQISVVGAADVLPPAAAPSMLAPSVRLSDSDFLAAMRVAIDPAARYGSAGNTERTFAALDELFDNFITADIDRLLRMRSRAGQPVRILFVGGGKFQERQLYEHYETAFELGQMTMTSYAREIMVPKSLRDKITVRQGDLSDLHKFFSSGTFDIVIVGDVVMPYVADKLQALHTFQALLTQGGTAFVSDVGLMEIARPHGVYLPVLKHKKNYAPEVFAKLYQVSFGKDNFLPNYRLLRAVPFFYGQSRAPKYRSEYEFSYTWELFNIARVTQKIARDFFRRLLLRVRVPRNRYIRRVDPSRRDFMIAAGTFIGAAYGAARLGVNIFGKADLSRPHAPDARPQTPQPVPEMPADAANAVRENFPTADNDGVNATGVSVAVASISGVGRSGVVDKENEPIIRPVEPATETTAPGQRGQSATSGQSEQRASYQAPLAPRDTYMFSPAAYVLSAI